MMSIKFLEVFIYDITSNLEKQLYAVNISEFYVLLLRIYYIINYKFFSIMTREILIMRLNKKLIFTVLLTFILTIFFSGCSKPDSKDKKPVIYLYPTSEQKINVKLDFKGELTCTYPEYKNGWSVLAKPDGTLINEEDGKEYSYLFWEGVGKQHWDLSEGFVVKGEDTKDFLQETLSRMGLTPKEYNEFIVYWLPEMKDNKYNLIKFEGKAYEEEAKLSIDPTPDSILRVFMVYKPLNKAVKVKKQEIPTFERKGFTVVEWGGLEVK